MGACNKLLLFKLLELLLVAACCGLHYYSLERTDTNIMLLITATVGGYIVVLVGAFAAVVLGEPLPKRAWIFYCLAGVGLFAACGALAIHYQTESTYNKATSFINTNLGLGDDDLIKNESKTYGIAKGSVAIATALTFFIDAIFTFCAKPAA